MSQPRGAKLTTAAPIVVLGAAGFVGRALTARLAARGARIRAVTRGPAALPAGIDHRVAGTLDSDTEWNALFEGAGIVVHLASRAAARRGDESWVDEEVNTAATLARAAGAAGIRRIVFLSSLKAMGENSGEAPFRADAAPRPASAYGRAKLRIEAALGGGASLVVLRPPLVYGPGVGGNFRALMGLVARGIPLPLASIENRRSFVFIDNLIDVIERAGDPEAAPAGVYLMRDDTDIATPDLVRRMGRHLGRAAWLIPCPPAWLRLGLGVLGLGREAGALLDWAIVDDAPTRALLHWRPRVSLDDGIAATCRWFQQRPR